MREYFQQICLLEEPDRIRIKSPAKINLLLNVLGKRPDGYHEVENIMQTISLHDVIEIRRISDGIEFRSDSDEVPVNRNNFILQAVDAFSEAASVHACVHIHLKKRIPVAGGLGGGSSNAAVTLLALNRLYDEPLTLEDLRRIASKIGSDAAFFLYGGAAICYGRGEEVHPIQSKFKFSGILLKPQVRVLTASIYKKFKLGLTTFIETDNMVSMMGAGAYEQVLELCYNSLEKTVYESVEGLDRLKEILLQCGSSRVTVSGSGPSLFGFFDVADIDRTLDKVIELAGDNNYIIVADSEM